MDGVWNGWPTSYNPLWKKKEQAYSPPLHALAIPHYLITFLTSSVSIYPLSIVVVEVVEEPVVEVEVVVSVVVVIVVVVEAVVEVEVGDVVEVEEVDVVLVAVEVVAVVEVEVEENLVVVVVDDEAVVDVDVSEAELLAGRLEKMDRWILVDVDDGVDEGEGVDGAGKDCDCIAGLVLE